MAFDYTDAQVTAQALVNEFGRLITLIQLAPGPADPAVPWRGATDPRGAPIASKTCNAVFVDPTSLNSLGLEALSDDFVKRATQIAIIATTVDLQAYNEVVDFDSSRWRVTFVRMLKPGSVNVLSYVGVMR